MVNKVSKLYVRRSEMSEQINALYIGLECVARSRMERSAMRDGRSRIALRFRLRTCRLRLADGDWRVGLDRAHCRRAREP